VPASTPGRNQALRIPREFEIPGTEVVLRKNGDQLIVSPAQSKSRLLEVLAKLKPLKEEFSDVDEGVMNPDDNPF